MTFSLRHPEAWSILIPARLGSTRLENKPLQDLRGKPLIIRVYENLRAIHSTGVDVRVLTDSQEVSAACQAADVPVQMTGAQRSGTDRCAEVAHTPYVLNVQGDEPFIQTKALLELMAGLESEPDFDMGTLFFKSKNPDYWQDPSVVKVVGDKQALYFSRASIPAYKNNPDDIGEFACHVGVYAYRLEALQRLSKLPPHPLEEREGLEQLRALANGFRILLVECEEFRSGIDTPGDLERARVVFR